MYLTLQSILQFVLNRKPIMLKNIYSLYLLNHLMCKLLLHCLPSTSGKSQIENVDGRGFGFSVCELHLQQAKQSTLMFINRTLIITVYIYYTVLTTNIATNNVSCLLYFRTQCKQYTQCVYNWCLQSLQIHTKLTTKVQLPTYIHTSLKFTKLVTLQE